MKPFFVGQPPRQSSPVPTATPQVLDPNSPSNNKTPTTLHSARLAIYDSAAAAPRVADIEAPTVDSFIEAVSSATYQAARDLGGDIPYTAVREIAENLIHAKFTEPVVSVLEGGSMIRFADRGPGISDKTRVLLPGFSTATGHMKKHIRGVGSGFPIVREYLDHHQGVLEIDDNLGGGAVVTLRASSVPPAPTPAPLNTEEQTLLSLPPQDAPQQQPPSHLSTRHKRVLSLVLEVGAVGPTLVSNELGVGLSTAHRDLGFLEKAGLMVAEQGGKRVLTDEGARYMDELSR